MITSNQSLVSAVKGFVEGPALELHTLNHGNIFEGTFEKSSRKGFGIWTNAKDGTVKQGILKHSYSEVNIVFADGEVYH